MRKKVLSTLLTAMFICMSLAGCGSNNEVIDNTEKKESTTAAEASEDDTETASEDVESVTEATTEKEEKVVEYGDTIRVSCVVTAEGAASQGPDGEYRRDEGESTIVVSKDSPEFAHPDFGSTDEEISKNVDKALGKKEGETFVIGFEFGDGYYKYNYTILEIKKAE